MRITKFNFSRIAAVVLFIYMWSTGVVSGVMAWFFLLLLIDLTIELKR